MWSNKTLLRFRYSRLFLTVWLYLRPGAKKELSAQKKYYEEFLQCLKPGKHTAIDVGANEGFVTAGFLEKGLSVIAVEPDERNTGILNARFGNDPGFQLYPYAAGSGLERLRLYVQKEGGAFSTVSDKWKKLIEAGDYRFHAGYNERPMEVRSIALDELISKSGIPSLVKIDVEGYELMVMKGLHQPVPLLIFEANLPEFLAETLGCLEQLHQIDEKIIFNYSVYFQWGLNEFLSYNDFRNLLPAIDAPCIDVICIMSNYNNYFSRLPGKHRGFA